MLRDLVSRVIQALCAVNFIMAVCCLPALAVTAPTITPSTGTYATQQSVTMSAPAGTIYYEYGDKVPTNSSPQYTSALTITTPTRINAVAYQSGTYSAVTTAYLDVDPRYAMFIPNSSTQLALRLRSDFGVLIDKGSPAPVTTWIDLSGESGSTVTATDLSTAPILSNISSGNPSVRFTGASKMSITNSRFNTSLGSTFFVVTKPNSLTAGSRIFDFGQGVSGNNILFRIADTGSYGVFSTYNGTSPTSVTSAAALTAGQYQLLGSTQSKVSPYTATFYVNGVGGTSGSMNDPPSVSHTSSFFGQSSAGGNNYSGDLAEVALYYGQGDSLLTAAQINAITAYFLQKYQILSQVPPTPTISVPTSTLLQPTQVTISTEPGAITFITTDGTTPDSQSTPFLGIPLQINYSQTLKAITIKNGVSSSVATAVYTLDSNQFPAPSPSDVTAPTINVDLPAPSL